MSKPLLIMGIDPGLANTGWGIIEVQGSRKKAVAYGCCTTQAHDPIDKRLKQIYDSLVEVIERYHPTELGIESIFFSANAKSAIATGQARGAALVAVASAGLVVGEYTPLQIKRVVVGNGVADKNQVQYMVRAILGLDHDPKPDHAADALGAAICHAHLRSSVSARYEAQLKREAEQLEHRADKIAASQSPASKLAAAELSAHGNKRGQHANSGKMTPDDLAKLGLPTSTRFGQSKRLSGWE